MCNTSPLRGVMHLPYEITQILPCHPAEVNNTGRSSIYQPWKDGRLLALAHGCQQPCPTLELSVADMDFACGRYGIGCGRCGLWPIRFVADIVVIQM